MSTSTIVDLGQSTVVDGCQSPEDEDHVGTGPTPALLATGHVAGPDSYETGVGSTNDLPLTDTLHVPVHNITWCSCLREEFPAPHVAVRSWIQSVATGQAIAVSYGIGDFDRAKHIFGHVDNGLTTQQVELQFGGEWDIDQVMKALVELSESHGAIWMDQLSIPQDTASIATNLQNMPQIYRTLDVVVLLPDALYSCLKDIVDLYDAGHSDSSVTSENGSLDVSAVVGGCLNAFLVSSYHFRLWTKQEFTYARSIRIQYSGAPVSSCSPGVCDWMYHASTDLASDLGHLSRWSRWKYGQCVEIARQFEDQSGVVACSEFRQTQSQGRLNLFATVMTFYVRRDDSSSRQDVMYEFARFLLGTQLRRKQNTFEASPFFEGLHSTHVASEPRDFALAVLPAIRGYRIPDTWQEMTLPQLVDDGVEQYERSQGQRCQTRLPKGLFETGGGSMRCKPSLYLPVHGTLQLEDVYGALHTLTYPALPGADGRVMLHLRDGSHRQPVSRLSQARTYSEEFGGKSTTEPLDFIRKARKFDFGMFGKAPFGALAGWADSLLTGRRAAPTDHWPSPDHEKAIFKQSLLRQEDFDWDSWPEVNHERVCFELMCDFVSIDPVVAREKGLGLIVKTEEPPCIGFVNGAVYNAMRRFEHSRREHSVDMTESSALSENCLTLVASVTTSSVRTRFVSLEAMKADYSFDPAEIGQDPRSQAVPVYHVVGVWFFSARDDPSIGADLTESRATCDAILV
jgi:hypothetical protein